jgi:HK97 family phage portal protein
MSGRLLRPRWKSARRRSRTRPFQSALKTSINLPLVTVDSALGVPAFAAGVAFLSRTLAALPLHSFRRTDNGPQRMTDKVAGILHSAPNDDEDSFKLRQYFWQQVFTGGRGLIFIERGGRSVEGLWSIDPTKTTVRRVNGRLVYKFENKEYPASDVIDVPFMLKSNGVGHYGPVALGGKAIQLAIAMNDYGSNFFAGGGVPPLSLKGPMPSGPEGVKRAKSDIKLAIDGAKSNGDPIFPIPAGYSLDPVGFDPAKGQMIDARKFQVLEIARLLQLPPNFLADLSHASFSNVEQNDLYLVKHLVGQWAKAFEGQANLKIYGRGSNRYCEHNLDGLLRGDFKTRMEGYARAVQTAQLTPNEVRAKENLPKIANPAADQLHIQGATVPLGSQPIVTAPANTENGDGNDDQV